jgi:hypothetical protein
MNLAKLLELLNAATLVADMVSDFADVHQKLKDMEAAGTLPTGDEWEDVIADIKRNSDTIQDS